VVEISKANPEGKAERRSGLIAIGFILLVIVAVVGAALLYRSLG